VRYLSRAGYDNPPKGYKGNILINQIYTGHIGGENREEYVPLFWNQ
jgi:hypothetical protein